MNKKLLIFGLFVFIAGVMAISYVSAGHYVSVDENYESSSYMEDGVIKVSDTENKILKDGKAVTKTVKISKEIKTYGKSKTKTFKTVMNKKTMKTQIKKAVKGKSVDETLNDKLFEAKIIKITFKNIKIKDHGHKYTGLKIIIKYKPAVYKTVTKTTKATITADEDGYTTIKYTNPFNGKKITLYGDLI